MGFQAVEQRSPEAAGQMPRREALPHAARADIRDTHF